MRGEEPGSFLTVTLGPPLPWELPAKKLAILLALSQRLATYGDEGFLFSGEALAAGPSCEVAGIREGEQFAGALGGRATVGQFFGLGSRAGRGEDNGAAVAGAIVVDMVDQETVPSAQSETVWTVEAYLMWDRTPPAGSGALTRATSSGSASEQQKDGRGGLDYDCSPRQREGRGERGGGEVEKSRGERKKETMEQSV